MGYKQQPNSIFDLVAGNAVRQADAGLCSGQAFFRTRSFFAKPDLVVGLGCQGAIRQRFYSGDSGYGSHFKEIGRVLGPFDLAIIENGAYNRSWPYVHSTPEEAVQAYLDVQGKLLLPVHWSTFDLSTHSWNEPIARLVKEADRKNIDIVTPRIGERVDLGSPVSNSNWWSRVE